MSATSDKAGWAGNLVAAVPEGAGQLLGDIATYLGSGSFMMDLATVGGVLFLDHMWRGPGKSSLSRLLKFSRSTRADLLCFGLTSTLLMGLLIMLLSFGIGGQAHGWLARYTGVTLVGSLTNPLLQGAVFLVMLDFLSYWRHRLSHQWQWWWELHKYHHTATELTVLTSYRLHPADMAASEVFLALPMALVGVPVEQYVLVRSLVFMQGLVNHSLLDWRLGPLGRIVVSPWAHRIHHSTVPEHLNRNYGGVFSVWDQLFGTWYRGERLNSESEIGVPDNGYNQRNVFVEFLQPVWHAGRILGAQLRAKLADSR